MPNGPNDHNMCLQHSSLEPLRLVEFTRPKGECPFLARIIRAMGTLRRGPDSRGGSRRSGYCAAPLDERELSDTGRSRMEALGCGFNNLESAAHSSQTISARPLTNPRLPKR